MVDQRERIGQTVGDYRLLKWLGGGKFWQRLPGRAPP